jgi:hypothetical protein
MGRHYFQKGASGAVHDNVAPRCCGPLPVVFSPLVIGLFHTHPRSSLVTATFLQRNSDPLGPGELVL